MVCTEGIQDRLEPLPEWVKRPCEHNDWDDVRQRKGVKMLRCRVCNTQWRWPRGARRGDKGLERCIDFLNDRCKKSGPQCSLLHIRRQKVSLEDRVKLFGSTVLSGVPQDDRKLKAAAAKLSQSVNRQEHSTISAVTNFADAWKAETIDPTVDVMPDVEVACLEGLAMEVAHLALAASGPSTPRGTAGVFHKSGPPAPEGYRRANTPPPLERPLEEPTIELVNVKNPDTIEFASRAATLFLGMTSTTSVKWQVCTLKNNTIGMVPRPRASTHSLRYLGSFATFEECKAAAEKGQYYAFTWHQPQCPRALWRLQGYGFTVPNHNSCNGVIAEHYDPPVCAGTITARLVVDGMDATAGTFGCFSTLQNVLFERVPPSTIASSTPKTATPAVTSDAAHSESSVSTESCNQ